MRANHTNHGKKFAWKHRQAKNLGKIEGIKNRTVLYCWKVNNTGEYERRDIEDPYYFIFDAAFREQHIAVCCEIDQIRDFINDVNQYREDLRQERMTAITSDIILSRMRKEQDQRNRYNVCKGAFREVTVDAWRDLRSDFETADLSTMQETFDFVIDQILSLNTMDGLNCREILSGYFGELFELENALYEGSAVVSVHYINEDQDFWDKDNKRYWTLASLHFTHRPFLKGRINQDYAWRISASVRTDIFDLEEIDMGYGDVIIDSFSEERKESRPIVVELAEEDMTLLIARLENELQK